MTREQGSQGYSGRSGGHSHEPEVRGTGFEAVVPNPKLKLKDQVREVLRLRHSISRSHYHAPSRGNRRQNICWDDIGRH
jgi:hypothetical protein